MKKVLITLLLLSLAQASFARSATYFLLPETGARASSALVLDCKLNQDRNLELTYFAAGQSYLLTPNYQIGLHGKFDLGKLFGFNFTGLAGLGLTQTTQSGTGFPLDLGYIAYRELNNRIDFSCPFVVSIYSNGALINYLPGLTLKTPRAALTLGFKGIAAVTSTSGHNRLLWALGIRTEF